METKPIYLDYNATTPVDPAVAAEMKPFIDEAFGNPSSIHTYGIRARMAVEKARKQLAGFLGCFPDEVIFTSGGTESNNYAIKGAVYANAERGNHIITTAVEHPAVTEVCRFLEEKGFRVSYARVDEYGVVDMAELEKMITPQTILITVMHANNETGTIQPIREISRIARSHKILFHTDAAQSCGKIPVNVEDLGVDLLSVAGHKLYAPKGIGALYIRRGTQLEKMIHGADHEGNRRAGTENVIEAVGLGKAVAILTGDLAPEESGKRMSGLRDRLLAGIREEIPEIRINGHPTECLPNTLSVSFPRMEANRLLEEMQGIAASAGAACHSDRTDISPVLTAMQVPMEYAIGTIRFSVGRMTTGEEVEKAVGIITEAVKRLSGGLKTEDGRQKTDYRLTHYTHSLGCACKIRPQLLEKILRNVPVANDANVLVDQQTSDDAAVYRMDDKTAIVQTVDFIPPVVDDPYSYGAIAAANSLSDIYAMGGKPLFALSIVAFPEKLLPAEVLDLILKGASDKTGEAGIAIIGGHTIDDTEPKFGLVVTGLIHPERILRNSTPQPGDAIVLTKPIGTGILSTAMKRGMTRDGDYREMIRSMAALNRDAAELLPEFRVHACTDVTGFGLLGHLREMASGAGIGCTVSLQKVPLFPGVWDLATAGIIPGGTKNNLAYVSDQLVCEPEIPETGKYILADAQTSGGLLIALPQKEAAKLVSQLRGKGAEAACVIGRFTDEKGVIRITNL
jgi:cysteine desulfurase